MTGDELFLIASQRRGQKTANGSYEHSCGLSMRTFRPLRRSGFVRRDGEVDVAGLKQAVATGEIYGIRQIGRKAVREICNWLARQAKSSA